MAWYDDVGNFALGLLPGGGAIRDLTGGFGGSDGGEDDTSQGDTQNANAQAAIDDLTNYMPNEALMTPDYMYTDPTQYLLSNSEAGNAYADPAYIAAQNEALSQLTEWGHGGLTAADQARLQYGRMQEDQNERANREAILNQMEARGMGGSGASLAAQLSSDQGRANRLSQQDMEMQQAAMARALQSMNAAGDLSSQARSQSFGESYQRGSAIDSANQGNLDYLRGEEARNNQTYNQGADNASDAARDWYDAIRDYTGLQSGQSNTSATRSDEQAAGEESAAAAEAAQNTQLMASLGSAALNTSTNSGNNSNMSTTSKTSGYTPATSVGTQAGSTGTKPADDENDTPGRR
jgi:hypothetical protein